MILEILHAVIGLTLGLFLPGYILTLILFKKLNQIDKISLAIGLSICIDIAVGLFLGANETARLITGGITESSIWHSLLIVTGVFLTAFLLTSLSRNKAKGQ